MTFPSFSQPPNARLLKRPLPNDQKFPVVSQPFHAAFENRQLITCNRYKIIPFQAPAPLARTLILSPQFSQVRSNLY
jgi:hypothetical protein